MTRVPKVYSNDFLSDTCGFFATILYTFNSSNGLLERQLHNCTNHTHTCQIIPEQKVCTLSYFVIILIDSGAIKTVQSKCNLIPPILVFFEFDF